nr:hypothetical protein [Tanacetum cinerariifolium]
MMEPTMEEYMTKTREGYSSGIVRPKIEEKDHFELKGQFLKELRDNTFNGSDNEDDKEHIEKLLKIVDLFHIPNITQDQMDEINNFQQDPDETLYQAYERFNELLLRCLQYYLTDMQELVLFYKGLNVPTRQILDSKGAIPSMKAADAKIAIQEMADYSQKWHNETSTREIKKVNEKVYATQVGCELCKGPHSTKDCPLKEEGKTLEEAYYTPFGVPFPQGGQYRATASGLYQRNNGNPSYQERRQTMEESLSKFMSESAKRHEENSNLAKEIRAATVSAIRNQGASIKALEIQIGQMSKVLQERGSKSLHSSTETNPRDHVKLISTTVEADTFPIRCIAPSRYAVSSPQNTEGSCGPKNFNGYSIGTALLDDALPPKEKDPGSFTLPCYINSLCFNKTLADLGASISVMPFSTYTKLGLGELAPTKLIVELADRTVKHPKGIAENVLTLIIWQERSLNFDSLSFELQCLIILRKLPADPAFAADFHSCADIVWFLTEFWHFQRNPYLHDK